MIFLQVVDYERLAWKANLRPTPSLDSILPPEPARPVIVLVPGLQGRDEWLRPAADELARTFEVRSLSLYRPSRPAADPFEAWVSTIDDLLAEAGASRATILGHSFGGLVAVRYAARRPERVAALVLASAPSPRMALDSRSRFYLRFPWATLPLFVMQAAFRLAPEMVAARPTWRGRAALAASQLLRVVRSPATPGRMARWVRAWRVTDIWTDCARVVSPTLVLTGEPGLDRVVPVASSREYLEGIRQARHVVLEGTGHLGLISRPALFAEAVRTFVRSSAADAIDDQSGPPVAAEERS